MGGTEAAGKAEGRGRKQSHLKKHVTRQQGTGKVEGLREKNNKSDDEKHISKNCNLIPLRRPTTCRNGYGNILNNVAKALDAYPLYTTDRSDSDQNHVFTIEIKKTYIEMLEAVIRYIKEKAISNDVLASGPRLVDAIGGLKAEMEKAQSLAEEDQAIKATLQPITDAIVVRRGRRLRQHVRSMSESVVESRHFPLLEKEWFTGNTPAALEDYSEWITTHRSLSLDSTSEPRDLFLDRWNQERGPREQTVDLEPAVDDGDEEKPRR